MGLNAHPGRGDAHQLQTALAHPNRAKHKERGFKACPQI